MPNTEIGKRMPRIQVAAFEYPIINTANSESDSSTPSNNAFGKKLSDILMHRYVDPNTKRNYG